MALMAERLSADVNLNPGPAQLGEHCAVRVGLAELLAITHVGQHQRRGFAMHDHRNFEIIRRHLRQRVQVHCTRCSIKMAIAGRVSDWAAAGVPLSMH